MAFTFNRIMDPILDSPVRQTFSSTVEDIVVVDDYTIRFDLVGPNSFFIPSFSLFQARILPANVDVSRLTLEEFGSGPFMIVEHLPGERTTMVRNPDYWDPSTPFLDELVIVLIREPATRAEALKSGDVDLVYDLETQSIAGLEAHSDTVVIENTSFSWIGLPMRFDRPPFDDILVRKAFQLATDRESINQAAYLGKGSIAYDHPIHPSHPLYSDQCKPPDYDPEAAKALLAEPDTQTGSTLLCTPPTCSQGRSNWRWHTKRAPPRRASGSKSTGRLRTGSGTLCGPMSPSPSFIGMARPTPDQALTQQNLGGPAWNAPRYNNPKFDELLIRARGEQPEQQKSNLRRDPVSSDR